ncbi:MAG: MaoC family dehydratase [Kofleriaceae bacterium]|jgi:2-methylfumaryl-CoA hydratase|nr:MaoC family dehydratase [Kofleriaceae bacterium]MBP9168958.1 MaoC family dehydratase [Kofleriaceae bacterium]MBP9858811.1 MaoC family dehydratase [Kofleriaceae bacterium]
MAHGTRGNFFEDFRVGQRFVHPTPRTLHGGDLALYIGLTGDRRPVSSSTEFARSLGFAREVVHDLLGFHVVFGKTVGDISHNAVANLGYARVLFPRPIYPGDTLTAETEVIGVRELSDGKRGIVYVASRGHNQKGQEVVSFYRWVMVAKRDPSAPAPTPVVPNLPPEVPAAELPVPEALNLSRFRDLQWATGGRRLWDDFTVGERLEHGGGMTIEDADHMLATRLYQNSARVHFDGHGAARGGGRRLVYGGHVVSVAHALAWSGLENVLRIAAWNSGSHVNPTYGGDTIYAYTDVLDRAALPGRTDLGAVRLKLTAVKNVDPAAEPFTAEVERDGKPALDPRVVLVLDYWGLVPR